MGLWSLKSLDLGDGAANHLKCCCIRGQREKRAVDGFTAANKRFGTVSGTHHCVHQSQSTPFTRPTHALRSWQCISRRGQNFSAISGRPYLTRMTTTGY